MIPDLFLSTTFFFTAAYRSDKERNERKIEKSNQHRRRSRDRHRRSDREDRPRHKHKSPPPPQHRGTYLFCVAFLAVNVLESETWHS